MESKWHIKYSDGDIAHHGILGMKWGVRRYQNKDGSLTNAGRKRYGEDGYRSKQQYQNRLNDLDTARSMLNKKIEARNNIKNKLIESKVKTDSYINFDGGTIGERIKSKALNRAIFKVDQSINEKMIEKEKGAQEMLQIIEKLHNSGFKISTKPTIKNVNSGKDYIANLIAGPTSALALGAATWALFPAPVSITAPILGGVVASAVLGTSIYSFTKNTTKGTKYKIE